MSDFEKRGTTCGWKSLENQDRLQARSSANGLTQTPAPMHRWPVQTKVTSANPVQQCMLTTTNLHSPAADKRGAARRQQWTNKNHSRFAFSPLNVIFTRSFCVIFTRSFCAKNFHSVFNMRQASWLEDQCTTNYQVKPRNNNWARMWEPCKMHFANLGLLEQISVNHKRAFFPRSFRFLTDMFTQFFSFACEIFVNFSAGNCDFGDNLIQWLTCIICTNYP